MEQPEQLPRADPERLPKLDVLQAKADKAFAMERRSYRRYERQADGKKRARLRIRWFRWRNECDRLADLISKRQIRDAQVERIISAIPRT